MIVADLLSTNLARGEDSDASETWEHHRSQRNHHKHRSNRQTSGEMRIESAFLQHIKKAHKYSYIQSVDNSKYQGIDK